MHVRIEILAVVLITLTFATPAAADDVTAAFSGGSLTIAGGDGDDVLDMVGLDADSLQVTPTAPTTLNGGAGAVVFDGVTPTSR